MTIPNSHGYHTSVNIAAMLAGLDHSRARKRWTVWESPQDYIDITVAFEHSSTAIDQWLVDAGVMSGEVRWCADMAGVTYRFPASLKATALLFKMTWGGSCTGHTSDD